VHREDHDARRGREIQHPPHRLVGADPARHLQIQEHHVGREFGDHRDGLLVGRGFADDLQIFGEGEHFGDAVAEEPVVVANRHPYLLPA